MTMFDDHRRRRVHDAIDDLERAFGITAHVGPDYRHIVISESDYEALADWARREGWRPDPLQAETTFTGVTIVTAPDWTCDTGTVAWLRLLVIVTRPFVRLVRKATR